LVINNNTATGVGGFFNSTALISGATLNSNIYSGSGGQGFFKASSNVFSLVSNNNILAPNSSYDGYTIGGNLVTASITGNILTSGNNYITISGSLASGIFINNNSIAGANADFLNVPTASVSNLASSNNSIALANNGDGFAIGGNLTSATINSNIFSSGRDFVTLSSSSVSSFISSNNTLTPSNSQNASYYVKNVCLNCTITSNIINPSASLNGTGIYFGLAYSSFVTSNIVKRYATNGIYIAGGNTNSIGLNTVSATGNNGVYLSAVSSTNIIGNTIVSGNSNSVGINLVSGTKQILIQGNLIGISGTGAGTAFGNAGDGIKFQGATNITVGGLNTSSRNVISNNGNNGIDLNSGVVDTAYIINNYIGVGLDGKTQMVNGAGGTGNHGIYINATSANYLTILNNVISSTTAGDGIHSNIALSNTIISGNNIGIGADGVTPVGLGGYGVYFNGAVTNLLLGGNQKRQRNIITNATNCSNNAIGLTFNGAISNATIAGSYFGVDSTGVKVQSIGKSAIFFNGIAINNLYVGLTGTYGRNVIGGVGVSCGVTGSGYCGASTGKEAIQIYGGGANVSNIKFSNNYIGLGADGVTVLPIGKIGLAFNNNGTGTNRIVGGTTLAEANYFAGGSQGSLSINQSSAPVTIISNRFGVDVNGNTLNMSVSGACYAIGIVDGSNASWIGWNGSSVYGNVVQGYQYGVLLAKDEQTTGSNNNIVYGNNLQYNKNGIQIDNGSSGNSIGSSAGISFGNTIQNNTLDGINIQGASATNRISENSISCNGLTQPLVGGVRSQYGINLNLINNNNANIAITPAFVYPPYILSTTGIQFSNTPTVQASGPAVAASDIIEVYYDPCGTCQGRTYLGNATLSIAGSTLYWSFPAGSIPSAAFCATTNPAGTCPSGIVNVSATRTNTAGNTSQFMPCSGVQALPVTFLSVDATLQSDRSVLVTWVTANENNNNYFVVERSADGITFESLGSVKGATNSAIALSYLFQDKSPLRGISYYRIRQVDLNGEFSNSNIVTIQVFGLSISVFPNPVKESLNLQLNTSDPVEANVIIYSILGEQVFSKQSFFSAGLTTQSVDVSGLPAGIYTVRILAFGEITTVKIAKE
jgi:hypothetical protein